MFREKSCRHINEITEVREAENYSCEECVKAGTKWVHLRTCQACGVTLCCDSSPSKHMRRHFHDTNHPVISSAEPGEKWLWCHEDSLFKSY